jgi:hypothetical protein
MEMTEYGKHGKPRSRLSTLRSTVGSNYPIDIAAPVVIDRLISGLDHPGMVKFVTIVVRNDEFPIYKRVLVNRLKLQLKGKIPA